MKTYSFLFLLLFSSSVFGQSAKKVNKQLRAEFSSLQKRQDSLFVVFSRNGDSLKFVQNEMKQKIKDQLYVEDKRMGKVVTSIYTELKTLKMLEIPTTDIFSEKWDYSFDPKYRKVVSVFKEDLRQVVVFDPVKTDGFNPDDYKLKEQNELLKNWIQTYKKIGENNEKQILSQSVCIDKIKSYHPLVDSLFQVYHSLNADFETKSDQLTQRILDARENYRLKGPKGFSAGYRGVFPDIHPITDQDIVVYDSNEITKDWNSGAMDNDGILGGPAPVPELVDQPVVYTIVDEPAEFTGGKPALTDYISKNLKYPQSAIEAGISGKVYLKFVVSEIGEILNVKILKGIPACKECDNEAMRVVRRMPKWIPGKINGKVVNSYFNLPVVFKL